MLTLPSSRKFIYPAFIFLAIVVILRVLIGLPSLFPTTTIHSLTLKPSTKFSYDLQIDSAFNATLQLDEQLTTKYHASSPIQPVRPSTLNLLQKCMHEPNPHTNHIRLALVRVLNISMVPSIDNDADFKEKQYFNPTLIPLPSHSPHPYLLISRLVTSGAHQESHVCFAEICSPASTSHLTPKTRVCTDEDLDFLGKQGGMRCVTRPERVNIGSTPARRCTGSWSTFVSIPGFHDPRVFWSGRGEAMIEVNSGSVYGCIGLWVQDLRAVYPPLNDVLSRKGRNNRGREQGDLMEDGEGEGGGKPGDLDLRDVSVRMGYPHLTELTRNPRESRNEVEKNWVLFFPEDGEAWVQYDVMGKVVRGKELGREIEGVVGEQRFSSSVLFRAPATRPRATESGTRAVENLIGEIGQLKRAEGEEELYLDKNLPKQDDELEHKANPDAIATHGTPALNSVALVRLSSSALEATPISPSSASATPATSLANTTASPPSSAFANSEPGAGIQLETHPSIKSITGGRTLSQLLSHGLTTPNLTSPLETPCFDLTDHTHEHDILNNTGHWHQGSNSLRLILCTREAFRTRSCLSSESSHGTEDVKKGKDEGMMHEVYEDRLREEGLVVHFSIIHRKFSNIWELPMRYERYFLVWEGRRPFRTLGVSKWPVLFGNEKARPWGSGEDIGWDIQREKIWRRDLNREEIVGGNEDAEEDSAEESGDGHVSNYFTYTPSIAWAWRGRSAGEDEEVHRCRGHEDLGTGHLGDEIVVGIGIDDVAQGFVKVRVEDVLGCMKFCAGVADEAE